RRRVEPMEAAGIHRYARRSSLRQQAVRGGRKGPGQGPRTRARQSRVQRPHGPLPQGRGRMTHSPPGDTIHLLFVLPCQGYHSFIVEAGFFRQKKGLRQKAGPIRVWAGSDNGKSAGTTAGREIVARLTDVVFWFGLVLGA